MTPNILTVVIIFSVIFPENLVYFPNFIKSLELQTYNKFKLFLVNDGVVDLDTYIEHSILDIDVINVYSLLPFELRIYALQKVMDLNPIAVVFADTDDIMCPSRIATSIHYLKKYSFVCNELSLMNVNGEILADSYWSTRIGSHFEFDIQFIQDKNVIGLGNSAVSVKDLDTIVDRLKNVSFGNDWLFFSAAEMGLKALFTNECKTFYRQHLSNYIGKKKITNQSLVDLLVKKSDHYTSLSSINFTAFDTLMHKEKCDVLLNKMVRDTEYLSKQVEKINSLEINFFWWEESNYIK